MSFQNFLLNLASYHLSHHPYRHQSSSHCILLYTISFPFSFRPFGHFLLSKNFSEDFHELYRLSNWFRRGQRPRKFNKNSVCRFTKNKFSTPPPPPTSTLWLTLWVQQRSRLINPLSAGQAIVLYWCRRKGSSRSLSHLLTSLCAFGYKFYHTSTRRTALSPYGLRCSLIGFINVKKPSVL